jgi:hypothetical protein
MKKTISLVLIVALYMVVEVANADFTLGEPTNLGPTVNGPDDVLGVSISYDGLELYFCSNRPGGYGGYDIWITTRPTIDDDWSTPVNLGPTVNPRFTQSDCMAPSISADGLTLYFSDFDYGKYTPGGVGSTDTWMVTRETKDAPWSSPVNLGQTVNWGGGDICPNISADGLSLYFASSARRGAPSAPGYYDLWLTTRATTDSEWGTPKELDPSVNSPLIDFAPSISRNSLVLFFCSDRIDGQGDYDIWMTSRLTKEHNWRPSVNLGPIVNSTALDTFPSISADGSTLYFCSARPGGFGGEYGDIYQAPTIPDVDFNADGKVDSADMSIMIDYWHTDYSLCDIAPTALGDGIVDVQDMDVLAEYLFKETSLVSRWKLDEIEGNIAYDIMGKNDGVLNGEPLWQHSGGKIDGALLLDGVDDYVSTDFILDPAKGSFSVFSWIKGGSQGQVIISQTDGTGDGTKWLWLDSSYGRLICWFLHPTFPPLLSESVITDGQWHHVGLVYDYYGLKRSLYVDGAEVAKDTDFVGGVGSNGGLYFGADKTFGTASFFSGLIDDVRIYDRALIGEEIAELGQ